MAGFLLTFCLFVTTVFLTIIPIFGISYNGADESPLYIITVLGTNGLGIFYIIIQEIMHHKKAQGRGVWPYFIPLFILLLFMIEVAFGKLGLSDYSMKISVKILSFFYACAASGIFVGTYCYRYDKFYLIAKNLEPLAILCSIGLIVSLPSMYVEGNVSSSIGGGGGHQTISYVAAICFAIFLISLKCKITDKRYRYKCFQNSYYRVLATILLIANAIICIIGGGRGGAVLLIINIIICLYYLSRKHFWRTVFFIALGITAFYFLSTNVSLWGIDVMFQQGFERAFAFIGSEGIDMSQTSERDVVYRIAQQLINEAPPWGYGIFYQYVLCQKYINQPYCHNIFYELMLQGGLLYLLLGIFVYIQMMIKGNKIILHGSFNLFLIAIVTYPVVLLMFSGTYLLTPTYWFSAIYIYGKSKVQ